MNSSKITIIGAGIGGLSIALALKKAGKDFVIYESASELKPVGAGIVLANNAMQVFEYFGIRKKIEKAGYKISSIKISDELLQNIQTTKLDSFEKKYGVYSVAIHRSELQKILAEEIGYEHIHLNKRISAIEKTSNNKIKFEDGSQVETEVLIGADGINSIVRKELFKNGKIRDTKQRCWRGVCDYSLINKFDEEAIEAWGNSKRFGFVKISTTKIYWFAVVNEVNMFKNRTLIEHFSEFHPDILGIITNTAGENILFNNLLDLEPFDKWQIGSVCLIGDAAHATTPNMGQGACQAIEDAYVFSKLLEKHQNMEEVFKEYELMRIKKAHYIVNTSWRLGQFIHHPNKFVQKLRNIVFQYIPKSINNKQMDKIFRLE
jgi:2-polyprenyl-6-methoxyphenol hydroxylase-like FAD-dependent oxidoreductase